MRPPARPTVPPPEPPEPPLAIDWLGYVAEWLQRLGFERLGTRVRNRQYLRARAHYRAWLRALSDAQHDAHLGSLHRFTEVGSWTEGVYGVHLDNLPELARRPLLTGGRVFDMGRLEALSRQRQRLLENGRPR